MMKDISSPFTPGIPVPVDYFVGRETELKRLLDKVKDSTHGRIEVEFLSGERGIGKSSLASFLRHIAETQMNVLGTHVFLGGTTSLEEMARRVIEELILESRDKKWYDAVIKPVRQYVKSVGLFNVSVEFRPPDEILRAAVGNFADTLRGFYGKLSREKDGLLIILDDINGLAESLDFANWFKSFVDGIGVSRKPLPITIVFVGYDERRRSLIRLQPSLNRVFDPIMLDPWNDEQTRDFFSRAFAKISVVVDEDAMLVLIRYTGGLPMLAHEIGDATFRANGDGVIDLDDSIDGVFKAAEIVGEKYLEPQVLSAIKSYKYKSILQKIVQKRIQSFSRADVAQMLNAKEEKVLGNFLGKMKKLGVLTTPDDAGKGTYRFATRLHYLYLQLYARIQ